MKFGIDFGTTNTIVSAPDQGNYPVVSFTNPAGDWFNYYPSLIAYKDGEFRYGFAARDASTESGWLTVRSVKSLLKHSDRHRLKLGDQEFSPVELLVGFLRQFKCDLIEQSNIDVNDNELSVSIAVPAHSNNIQRFLTVDCFAEAGFKVDSLINEPSASTMEYAKSYFKNINLSNKKYVLVYDLGGGTFDASVAEIHEQYHRIIATEGLDDLGGDQFDEVLAKMVLEQCDYAGELEFSRWVKLLEQCRDKKESLSPYAKNILIEWEPNENTQQVAQIPVAEYFQRCDPLLDKTVEVIDQLVSRVNDDNGMMDFSAIYLVGGMSHFPLINRKLKGIYGAARVRKSPHCASTVAIGLAVMTEQERDFVLRETLTRHFGVWREKNDGEAPVFVPIFNKDLELPGVNEPPLEYRSRYHPVHSLGIFRFQECSAIQDSKPSGIVTMWDQIKFPFLSFLQNQDLSNVEVNRTDHPLDYEIEELYLLNRKGEILVTLTNLDNGYSQTFQLSRTALVV